MPRLFGRWEKVAADPAPFLSLGLRDGAWLERRLPALIDAAEAAPVDGDACVHYDVRSDNMCFVGDRAVLVDWNWLSLGNPETDLAGWAPSLRLEGGPQPWELLPSSPGSRRSSPASSRRSRACRRRRLRRRCARSSARSSRSRSSGATGSFSGS